MKLGIASTWARLRASVWAQLLVRSLGTVGAVVALALVGGMPFANASMPLAPAEPPPATPSAVATPPTPPAPVAAPSAEPASRPRIELNTATAAELITLPGVGPKRAEAILALRQRLGRFRNVDELRRVRGIGRATLKKLREQVSVAAPPAS